MKQVYFLRLKIYRVHGLLPLILKNLESSYNICSNNATEQQRITLLRLVLVIPVNDKWNVGFSFGIWRMAVGFHSAETRGSVL
jgi:hypothetical protein